MHRASHMQVLVVDIGGTHVKVYGEPDFEAVVDSGDTLTPIALMHRLRERIEDLQYDAVSIGYPGAVGPDGPIGEAGNLGPGWVGFDFETAFERPVRVVNDAALQAIGNYDGGRMLFLGLGTGLGSSIVADHVIMPLELGSLEHDRGTVADHLGAAGLKMHGLRAWSDKVHHLTSMLKRVTLADYVVIGGGNAQHLDALPPDSRRGHLHAASVGGARLWEQVVEPHDRPPSRAWRILQ